MLRGVIFDCDGTLVDSRARMVPFYNKLFAACGAPLLDEGDPEAVAACVSLADTDIFARFVADHETRATVAERAAALSDDDLTADLSLMPHALETLMALRPALRLAVATNRVADMAAVTRRFSLDRYVDVIVTAADVDQPKPAPDMLLLAARRLRLEPPELLFVGDTEVDRQAAAAAGMGFVLYEPTGCKAGVSDLLDLGRLLRSPASPPAEPGTWTAGLTVEPQPWTAASTMEPRPC